MGLKDEMARAMAHGFGVTEVRPEWEYQMLEVAASRLYIIRND